MSLTRKNTADLNFSGTVKVAKPTRLTSSAAAASAVKAAQNAAIAAQKAAGVAQVATQNAAAIAASAAQNASDAAQVAAAGLSKGVRQGVYTARRWTAPRLETAADYCTTTAAPRVSSALRTTARQVRPPDARRSRRLSVLTWSVLGAAVLTAAGAAAALVRYRYQTAIAADSESADEDSPDSQSAPASPDGPGAKAAKRTDAGAESSANGKIGASGW